MGDNVDSQIYCPHCHGGNAPAASVCRWCHQPLQVPPTPEQNETGAGKQEPRKSAGTTLQQMFLNEEQDPTIVEQVRTKVEQILTRGEEMQYIAVQKKPGVNIAPDCVVLTNKRFIIYRPKIFGRVDFDDYIWRDLQNARLKESLLGATFSAQAVGGQVISVDYLPKAQARRIYQFAQEMEEYVREERRYRDMEVRRAGAAGIYMPTTPPPTPSMMTQPPVRPIPPTSQANAPAQQIPDSTSVPAPSTNDNPVEKLAQLKEMLDRGLIPQEVYEAKRDEIISRM